MTKEEVLYMLDKYKDRPFEIDTGDSAACIRGNIEGHWLFIKGDSLVEVKKNTPDGTYNYANTSQAQTPFKVTVLSFDNIAYFRSYITSDPNDVENQLNDLTPTGTSKTMEDIIKEIETDTIHNAASPMGYLNTNQTAPGTQYGNFKGTMISTEKGGIPANVLNKVLTSKT